MSNSKIPKVKVRLLFNEIERALQTCALIDTGSDECIISVHDLNDELKSTITPFKVCVNGVGKNTTSIGQVNVDLEIDKQVVIKNVKCIVMPTKIPTLIGQSVLGHDKVKSYAVTKNEVILEMVTGKVFSVPTVESMSEQTVQSFHITPNFTSVSEKVKWIKEELGVTVGAGGDSDQVEKMCDTVIKYSDVFGSESNMGCYPKPIELRTKGEPISARQHPIAVKFQPMVQNEIDRMLKMDVIEKTNDSGGWLTPIVAVSKKDGSPRICSNFKLTLNKRLVAPEAYSMPSCEEQLNHIKPNNAFFSSMDLYCGYWQCLIKEEDRVKTSFQWQNQLYRYKRLPFGFTASGNIFSKCIAKALTKANFNPSQVMSYVDDVCVMDSTFESFLQNHVKLFEWLRKHNLRLKGKKCTLLTNEVKFLGRIIDAKGIKPDPEQVAAVQFIQAPRTKRQLLQLQGRLTYLKAFCGTRMGERVAELNFSSLCEPIYEVGRIQPYRWTDKAEKALNRLKARISSAPFISLPNPALPYVLCTDASSTSIGGVLMQQVSETEHSIVALISKCLDKVQRRWSTLEREAYGLLYCIEKFGHWLKGQTFTVKCDHRSLTYLDQKVFNNQKLARWQERLSEYSFVCQYIPDL